jgi:hypothetical protein
MAKRVGDKRGESARHPLEVDTPVIAFPGTDQQQGGVIVEDFGESAGYAVEIGADRIAGAARRWAVRLNDDTLVFVDSEQISPL